MELFLEFILTIAFSLFSSFVLAKLFSVATTDDDGPQFSKTKTNFKFHEDDEDFDWETERKHGFVSKIAGFDELGDDDVLAKQEISINSSPVLEDELAREVEIVDLTEEDSDCDREKKEFEEIEIMKSDLDGEIGDDWEGIERSEMDRVFGAAVAYVDSIDNAHKILELSSDLKRQLYGLHQVAIQGPCFVPQPLALKVAARSKWNAWQQLGNMRPEVAMEHYINLLSKSIPGWMNDEIRGNQEFADNDECMNMSSGLNPHLVQGALFERSIEEKMPRDEGLDMGPNIKTQKLELTVDKEVYF